MGDYALSRSPGAELEQERTDRLLAEHLHAAWGVQGKQVTMIADSDSDGDVDPDPPQDTAAKQGEKVIENAPAAPDPVTPTIPDVASTIGMPSAQGPQKNEHVAMFWEFCHRWDGKLNSIDHLGDPEMSKLWCDYLETPKFAWEMLEQETSNKLKRIRKTMQNYYRCATMKYDKLEKQASSAEKQELQKALDTWDRDFRRKYRRDGYGPLLDSAQETKSTPSSVSPVKRPRDDSEAHSEAASKKRGHSEAARHKVLAEKLAKQAEELSRKKVHMAKESRKTKRLARKLAKEGEGLSQEKARIDEKLRKAAHDAQRAAGLMKKVRKEKKELVKERTQSEQQRCKAENGASSGEAPLCVVCWDRPRASIFRPCNHMACCQLCSKELKGKPCPICRERITAIQQVFVA
eukprot:GEMP01058654.1.p1 GENE.GEMP01058654.1~~GEMP01058654.1.p1  ORF type:complete len:405 (+),score=115.79 GEMP01058654.1:53-1267(+)